MFYTANAREWKTGETISGSAIAVSVVMNCSDAHTDSRCVHDVYTVWVGVTATSSVELVKIAANRIIVIVTVNECTAFRRKCSLWKQGRRKAFGARHWIKSASKCISVLIYRILSQHNLPCTGDSWIRASINWLVRSIRFISTCIDDARFFLSSLSLSFFFTL